MTGCVKSLERVAGDIFLVPGANKGRFPFSHSALILGKVKVLLETGSGFNTLNKLKNGFHPEIVIFSHGHPDHCSGSSVFSPDVLWGPEEGCDSTGDLKKMANRFIGARLRESWITYFREETGFEDFSVRNHFRDGHIFHGGHPPVQAIHVPGHTIDHYCFYFPQEKVLYSTDIDFTPFGPWYGNEESDLELFRKGICRIRELDMETVISPHLGILRKNIPERFDQFFKAFETRDEAILDFLAVPRTLEDFVNRALIYGNHPYRVNILRNWEEQMVTKHLNGLFARGEVFREGDLFIRRD